MGNACLKNSKNVVIKSDIKVDTDTNKNKIQKNDNFSQIIKYNNSSNNQEIKKDIFKYPKKDNIIIIQNNNNSQNIEIKKDDLKNPKGGGDNQIIQNNNNVNCPKKDEDNFKCPKSDGNIATSINLDNNINFSLKGNQNEKDNLKKELTKKEKEIIKLKDENIKLKENIDKLQKDIQIKLGKINLKSTEIEKKESELKTENEKLQKEKKRINDLIALNQQKESELSKHKLTLEQREKDIENKINQFKQDQKNFLKEKEKFNTIKTQLTQKDNEIKNLINQLNIRQNKIQQKELELDQREKIIIEKEKKYKIVLIGLNNIGATCYMNATLQCLSNSKKLTEYFLKSYKKDSNKIMANEYYEVIRNLWDADSKNKAYSPNSFKEVLSKENPLFAGVAANDSKDLINFLLERFHQELNVINANININNNNNNDFNQPDQTNEFAMLKDFLEEYAQKFNSPISNLFYGILETKSQCVGCNVIKYNFQVYSFLEFPLQQVNQYYFNIGKRPLLTNDGKNPDVNLYECFEYNKKIDLMSGENQMYCNICNKLCNAYYSTILYSGPNYLIINLNRGKGAVYECKVNFPNQLNIFNYVNFKDGVTAYELYAVICHLGPSSMSGHFVAYCRNRIDNQWYLYNDGIVTKCTRQFQYNDGMPYILFYRALISD